MAELQHMEPNNIPPLALILDIDGTIVAEGRHVSGIVLRPNVVEFLRNCKEKGYFLAIWTSAHSAWAHSVAMKLCKLIHQDDHECSSLCKRTFEFVWTGEEQRKAKQVRVATAPDDMDYCKWCGPYRYECNQCLCWQYFYACPCRQTKDLRKVWWSEQEETSNFSKHRTLIIENTPQKCRHNYGNAIYVPSFLYPDLEKDKNVFQKLGKYIETELESAENVREIQKCGHTRERHACYEQIWWES